MSSKRFQISIGMKRVAATYYDGPNRRPNYGKLNELRKVAEEKYSGAHRKSKQHKEKKHKDRKNRDRDDIKDEPFTREETDAATRTDRDGGGKGSDAQTVYAPPKPASPQKEKKQSESERRLDTFKKPTLKNRPRSDDGAQQRERKKPRAAGTAPPNPDTAGLTKAQRRNRRRALQRAQKTGGEAFS